MLVNAVHPWRTMAGSVLHHLIMNQLTHPSLFFLSPFSFPLFPASLSACLPPLPFPLFPLSSFSRFSSYLCLSLIAPIALCDFYKVIRVFASLLYISVLLMLILIPLLVIDGYKIYSRWKVVLSRPKPLRPLHTFVKYSVADKKILSVRDGMICR